jgi:capsular polysaccharide biosynthesis protein
VLTSPVSTFGRAVRRGLWLIALATLTGGAVAYEAAQIRAPVYEASALVSIDETQDASQGFDAAMQADQFLAQRFIALATSRETLQWVCATEGRGCDTADLVKRVRVTTPKATAQLQVVASGPSPEAAVTLANEVADALIAQNRAQVEQQVGPQRAVLQEQLKTQADQIAQTLQQVSANEAAGRLDAAGTTQLNFLQTQYSSTFARLQNLDVQRSQLANVLSVQQRAVPPAAPADPDPVRYVGIGIAGGLAGGLLLALLAAGVRTRIRRSADLAEVAGTETVVDFTRDLLPGAGRPYGFLARVSLVGPAKRPQALLIVGSTLTERVNDVAGELANVVASSGRRVMVLLAPTPRSGAWWWRRTERPTRVLVEPEGGSGEQRRSGDDVDLVIQCSLPPTLDPSVTWLRPVADRAVLVATRGVTRLRDVRQVVDSLGRLEVGIVAAILLPVRMRASRRPPVVVRSLPEPAAPAPLPEAAAPAPLPEAAPAPPQAVEP